MNLLYPNGKENTYRIEKDTYDNLALDEIVENIAFTSVDRALIREVFQTISLDENTILYRQEIMKDFMREPGFCDSLSEILKKLDVLKEYTTHNVFGKEKKGSLLDLIDYMQEMDLYIQIVEALNHLFQQYTMSSKGLKEVARLLQDVIDMNQIDELKKIVNHLSAEISTLKSMKVGLNLGPDLRPEEVVVLEYGMEAFPSQTKKQSFRERVTSLGNTYHMPDTFMKHICDDMERYLSKSFKQYKQELKEYVNFDGYFLLDICCDLRYFLLMARFGRRLQEAGNGLAYPTLNKEVAQVKLKGVYNIRLVSKGVQEIVKNDFSFYIEDRIYILTGPNRGGKTMLTQAVGIAAFFASQGLYIPGDSYEGFLFDNILTHFPADENLSLDMGRLGEEALRIQKIAKKATSRTLVLLNETYSSTSEVDGLYMAKDLLHVLKHNNVPTIYNTHLHELARQREEMNQWEGTAQIVSLTMEIIDNQNTFRVIKKEPDSSSYARNIALKYGVTYEQMLKSDEDIA